MNTLLSAIFKYCTTKNLFKFCIYLIGLSLHEKNTHDGPNVVVNLSRRKLNNVETTALNTGLQFSILPQHFDFLQTQASIERLYQETSPYLELRNRIELKRLFSTYTANINLVIFSIELKAILTYRMIKSRPLNLSAKINP